MSEPPSPSVLSDLDHSVGPGPSAAAGPPPHQCGRCRQLFAGDPSIDAGVVQDWWLCPPCRAKLLGDRPRAARSPTPPRGHRRD